MAIEVTHPLENQMFTARPVADRVNGTAIRVSITDGEHTLVEEGAPTASIQQNNARLEIALAALDSANARLAALEANAGMPVTGVSTAPVELNSETTAAAPGDEVAALEAQLAAAKAKLTGTDTYVASAA